MAAPDYVPTEKNRPALVGLTLPPARRSMTKDRPGALGSFQPVGPSFGRPGPDQGYALLLARSFQDRLVLTEGETREDAVAACVAVALKRASIFGRAPVIHDLEVAFTLFGFLGAAPEDLVEYRRRHLAGSAHHHHRRCSVADQVPEATLLMNTTQVRASFPAIWRELLGQEDQESQEDQEIGIDVSPNHQSF